MVKYMDNLKEALGLKDYLWQPQLNVAYFDQEVYKTFLKIVGNNIVANKINPEWLMKLSPKKWKSSQTIQVNIPYIWAFESSKARLTKSTQKGH